MIYYKVFLFYSLHPQFEFIKQINSFNILIKVAVKNKATNPINADTKTEPVTIVIAKPTIVVIIVPMADATKQVPFLQIHLCLLLPKRASIVKSINVPIPIPKPIHKTVTIPGISVEKDIYPTITPNIAPTNKDTIHPQSFFCIFFLPS